MYPFFLKNGVRRIMTGSLINMTKIQKESFMTAVCMKFSCFLLSVISMFAELVSISLTEIKESV